MWQGFSSTWVLWRLWTNPFLVDGCFSLHLPHLLHTSTIIKYKGHFTQKIESPWPSHSKHSRLVGKVEKVELVQVRFTLCLRDQRSMWMQDGCKVYMESYMASNGSCLMVSWTIIWSVLTNILAWVFLIMLPMSCTQWSTSWPRMHTNDIFGKLDHKKWH